MNGDPGKKTRGSVWRKGFPRKWKSVEGHLPDSWDSFRLKKRRGKPLGTPLDTKKKGKNSGDNLPSIPGGGLPQGTRRLRKDHRRSERP